MIIIKKELQQTENFNHNPPAPSLIRTTFFIYKQMQIFTIKMLIFRSLFAP